jgi:hypothetical protein
MDGEVLSASQHTSCAGSGGSGALMLLCVAYREASRFWRRLIVDASDAPRKILAAMLARLVSARSVARHPSGVWSNRWRV